MAFVITSTRESFSENAHSDILENNPTTVSRDNVSDVPVKSTAKHRESGLGKTTIWSKLRPFFVFGIFAGLAMTIGILVVCLTTSTNSSRTCSIMYKAMDVNLIDQDSRPRSVAIGDFNNDMKLDMVVVSSAIDSMTIFLGNGNAIFSRQTIYSTGIGSRPYSVAVGDFNNDKYLDIVVGNYDTHTIGIFLGYGNGNFTSQITYSIGVSHPLAVIVADVDHDNRSDIIVVNYGTNTIGIISGYNKETFTTHMLYSTGYDSLPYSIAIGDFNNDTRLDLVVTNYGTYTIGIFLGYGNGTFREQEIYFIGKDSRPCSVAVNDLNNDNYLDIVVANSGTGSVTIFRGFGNGSFTSEKTFSTDIYGSQQIAVGDIDNDNRQDIILTNHLDDSIDIFQDSNDGSYNKKIRYSTGVNSNPHSIIVVDLNNDQILDIIIINNGTNNVGIMLGYDPASFSNQTTYSTGYGSEPKSVAIGDFNNDHQLDLVVANYMNDNIGIFLATDNGTFSSQTTYSTGFLSYPQAVVVADLNDDRQLDIIVANFAGDNLTIFFGYGDGTFGNRTKYSTGDESGPYSIALADLNNDTRLDIVVANYRTGTIGVFLGMTKGKFINQTTYSYNNDRTSLASVAIGDFNGDHHLDIVASGVGIDSKIIIFFGLGNGTFINPIIYLTGYNSGAYSVGVADFNNDNKLDIVVTNRNDFNIGIFLGLGNGTFQDQNIYLTEARSAPVSITIADFNNDSLLDVVVAHSNTDNIGIFLGLGDGTFISQRRFSTGNQSSPSAVTYGDLNNDQRLDIVVVNSNSSNIGIFLGYDQVVIGSPQTYSTGSATNPHSVVIGDFNRDKQLDIAVANYGTNTISVLLGDRNLTFTNETNYPTGSDSLPKAVAVGDLNNDSFLDIIVANFGKDNIGLFLGNENGTFRNQTTFTTDSGSHPSSIAVTDFNDDNQSDLAIAFYGTDNLGIFLGYKYPDVTSQKTYSTGNRSNPHSLALGDFNNDTLLDIVVANTATDNIGVFLAIDPGNFADQISYLTGNGSMPQSVAVGDFNNDNRLDIVVVNNRAENIGVFLGYGNGTFVPQVTYPTGEGSFPQWIAVGDFNNDNRTDVVVSNSFGQNIGVFLAYSNGTFAAQQTYSIGDDFIPYPIIVDDFNGDNQLGILVVSDGFSRKSLEIFLGLGNGTFRNEIQYSIPLRNDATASSIALGDFNNDKQRDIVVCYNQADSIGVFLANGNVSFTSEKIYSIETNAHPQSIAVGDFNNDNRLDIVVANLDTNNVAFFIGFGDGTFQLIRLYSTGRKSGPLSIAVTDFNHDHVLDIIVCYGQSGSIGIFLGFYEEIFFRQLLFTTGLASGPQSVTIGDVNNDTHQDVIVANTNADNVGIFVGNGDGTFQNQTIYSTGVGSRPYSVAIGDFNSDNRLDIVVANYGNESIGLFLGLNNGTFASQMIYSIGVGSRPSSIATFDFNQDNRMDVVVTDEGTNKIVVLFGSSNGSLAMLTKYETGYNSRPCAVATGDLNNDIQKEIIITNCGTNNIGFVSKFC